MRAAPCSLPLLTRWLASPSVHTSATMQRCFWHYALGVWLVLDYAALPCSSKDINDLDEKSGGGGTSSLGPPREVTIDAVAEHSFTLRWKAPRPNPNKHVKLQGYMLSYAPTGKAAFGEEKALMLPGVIQSKLVTRLKEGTEYAVVLSAVYPNVQTASAPKMTVRTPLPVAELPVGDDSYFDNRIQCNCSEEGMVACTRSVVQEVACSCFPSYAGRWCESCAAGFFRVGKACTACPCTNATSTGECVLAAPSQRDVGKDDAPSPPTVSCKSCLPGHRGPLCSACAAGYHWKGDRCEPINCLSFALCAKDRDNPGCRDCDLAQNSLPPVAQKSSESALAAGAVPLVAVLATLCFLLAVTGAVTWYRCRLRKRTRAGLPFWSIELREDKSGQVADCPYQHLDAASSRVVVQSAGDEDASATVNTPKTTKAFKTSSCKTAPLEDV